MCVFPQDRARETDGQFWADFFTRTKPKIYRERSLILEKEEGGRGERGRVGKRLQSVEKLLKYYLSPTILSYSSSFVV